MPHLSLQVLLYSGLGILEVVTELEVCLDLVFFLSDYVYLPFLTIIVDHIIEHKTVLPNEDLIKEV
jgi:hypothetical protein